MDELRREFAKLGARIDAQVFKLVLANVPILAGVAVLTLAAVKFG